MQVGGVNMTCLHYELGIQPCNGTWRDLILSARLWLVHECGKWKWQCQGVAGVYITF